MSDTYPIKFKKNCKVIFLSEQIKQEVADLLINRDDFFEKGLCVRRIPGKRETWQISPSGETYYVKIFWNNIIRKIGFLLGLSKAKKELLTAQKLKSKNILVPEMVAYICEKGKIFALKEYLITKEITGGERLKDFVFNVFYRLPREKQKKIVADFAVYIRKLHDIGVIHSDPNLGNFLIKQDSGKNYFYLLDLADVNIKSSLSLKERWNNLSLLNLSFLRRVPKSLRFYFLKNYAQGLLFKKADFVQAIKMIEAQTLHLAKKTWAKRLKWCFENNSFFIGFKKSNLKVHVKKDWSDNRVIRQALSSPDVFLVNGKGVVLKDGRTVKAARIDIGEGRSVFLKRYNKKGWLHTFKNIFRSSRASRVWKISWGFELRGIASPIPVAYMEERKFRILKRSYIISEFIEDAETMSVLFGQNKLNLSSEQKISIMQEVGREIGAMHALGCVHGDLKWSNILIKKNNGKIKFYFVDLDGAKISKRLALKESIQEIARFYIEMLKYGLDFEEQMTFLNSYFKHSGLKTPYESFFYRIKKEALKKI